MLATTSVGSMTSVCSLSDQVKKYKSRVIAEEKEEGNNRSPGSFSGSKVESLVILCVKVITARFSMKANPMQGIPAKFIPEITMRLPLDLSIKASAPHIQDENYWKRCCIQRPGWTNLQIAQHGLTWKQLYLGNIKAMILAICQLMELLYM